MYSLAGQILKFDYGATQIIVSVCGIIHPEYNSSIPCSGPGYAACHIRDNTVIRIMGMQGQAPEVTADGAIRIVYPGKSLVGYFFLAKVLLLQDTAMLYYQMVTRVHLETKVQTGGIKHTWTYIVINI